MKDRILFLGPESPLLHWLRSIGETVTQTEERISELGETSFIISYNYRHIITKDVLERFPHSAVNLHISYLPWNRGADPNFWSFVDDTPKGVTIHYLDPGIDTGDIIAQTLVPLSDTDTLASSYTKLHSAIQRLFKREWPSIKAGTCARTRQSGHGSFHLAKAKEPLMHLLTRGWDTPVSHLSRGLVPTGEADFGSRSNDGRADSHSRTGSRDA